MLKCKFIEKPINFIEKNKDIVFDIIYWSFLVNLQTLSIYSKACNCKKKQSLKEYHNFKTQNKSIQSILILVSFGKLVIGLLKNLIYFSLIFPSAGTQKIYIYIFYRLVFLIRWCYHTQKQCCFSILQNIFIDF